MTKEFKRNKDDTSWPDDAQEGNSKVSSYSDTMEGQNLRSVRIRQTSIDQAIDEKPIALHRKSINLHFDSKDTNKSYDIVIQDSTLTKVS